LLQTTTSSGPYAGLHLFPLRLQYRGSKERHLLPLLCAAQKLRVVEIAYTSPNYARRVRVAFFDKHEQRTASPAAGACPPAATARAAATTAATAAETPASR
jgi:hypothetical protein